MRRARLTLALVFLMALTACDGGTAGSGPGAPSPGAVPMIMSGSTCGSAGTTPAPAWADAAGPGLPKTQVLSTKGDVVAALFVKPRAAPRDDGVHNSMLFIVGKPRGGQPLRIKATPVGGGAAVYISQEVNSGPGETYRSTVDVPEPGCWHLELSWNGHTDSMDLRYGS